MKPQRSFEMCEKHRVLVVVGKVIVALHGKFGTCTNSTLINVGVDALADGR